MSAPPPTSTSLADRAPLDRRLSDGMGVRLRPIIPQDRERIQRAYALLSEASRYQRFWERPPQLREAHAERLSSTDGKDHVGWIALNPEDADFPGFGGASYWRCREDPTQAEVALTIADAWQRRGLATLLFSVLWFEGWREGIRTFTGQCLRQNRAIRRWWQEMGGQMVEESRLCRLRLDLEAPDILLQRIAFEIRPGPRRVEVAEWMRDWQAVAGTASASSPSPNRG